MKKVLIFLFVFTLQYINIVAEQLHVSTNLISVPAQTPITRDPITNFFLKDIVVLYTPDIAVRYIDVSVFIVFPIRHRIAYSSIYVGGDLLQYQQTKNITLIFNMSKYTPGKDNIVITKLVSDHDHNSTYLAQEYKFVNFNTHVFHTPIRSY